MPKAEFVSHSGSIIPSPDRRWCGPEFKDNNYYLRSAEAEARRLVDELGCSSSSRVLDVGCGQGRLAIGLIRVLGEVNYTGIDVDKTSIDWCSKHLAERRPNMLFLHLDLFNERYNRKGNKILDEFRLPVPDASADIIYLYSVFSHLTERDMRAYLNDFNRILGWGGKLFFTTFIEEDVPDVSINPDNYRVKCTGPLHVVRYRKDYIFDLANSAGYVLKKFVHGQDADGQSGLYLEKRTT